MTTAGSQPSVHVNMIRNVIFDARMFCLEIEFIDRSRRHRMARNPA